MVIEVQITIRDGADSVRAVVDAKDLRIVHTKDGLALIDHDGRFASVNGQRFELSHAVGILLARRLEEFIAGRVEGSL